MVLGILKPFLQEGFKWESRGRCPLDKPKFLIITYPSLIIKQQKALLAKCFLFCFAMVEKIRIPFTRPRKKELSYGSIRQLPERVYKEYQITMKTIPTSKNTSPVIKRQ